MKQNKIGDFIIKKSKHEGYGFFSTRSYKSGEKMTVWEGVKIKDIDRRLSHRAIQYSQHKFLEPKRYSLGYYLNHSCEPNAYVDGISLFSRKPLKPGDEITVDYSLFTNYPTWDMKCLCGSKNCRGLIVPYSKLPQILKKKYRKWTSKYLKNQYKSK